MHFHPGSAAPVWSGLPQELMPGATGAGVILGRGPNVVGRLNPLHCYPTGVELSVAVRAGVRVPGLFEKVVSGPSRSCPAGTDPHGTCHHRREGGRT